MKTLIERGSEGYRDEIPDTAKAVQPSGWKRSSAGWEAPQQSMEQCNVACAIKWALVPN